MHSSRRARWIAGAVSFWIWAFLVGPVALAVNLGGTEVPKEKLIVYLLIGHCNMSGRETNCDTQTNPRAWNYQIKDNTHTSDVGWILAKPPLHTEGMNNAKCGPGLIILKRLIEKYPADYYFAALQNADPGATVDGDYRRGKALYTELIAAAKKVQQEATLGGVIAMLDVFEIDQQRAQGFSGQIKSMVEEMRADLGVPALPLFIYDYQPNSPKYVSHPYKTTIQAQFQEIPKVLTGAGVVPYTCPANLFMTGSEHFSRKAYEDWTVALVDSVIMPGGDRAWPHPWYPAAGGTANPPGTTPTGPKAVISAPGFAAVNQPVELDGSSSVGTIQSYAWTLGGNVTLQGAKVSHTWTQPGKDTITLTVTDDQGKKGTAQAGIEIFADTNPRIVIHSPQGGESWPAGSTQAIRWTAYFLKDVKLFYSTNGGADWTLIGNVDSTYPTWENYSWATPAVPSASCQIMIEGYDNEAPTRSQPFALSDGARAAADGSSSASKPNGVGCSTVGNSLGSVLVVVLLVISFLNFSRAGSRPPRKRRLP
jgi:hypothetical protein